MAAAQSVHICAQVPEVLDLDSDVLTEGSDDHCDADPGQHKDQDHAASASTVALLIVVLLLASLRISMELQLETRFSHPSLMSSVKTDLQERLSVTKNR